MFTSSCAEVVSARRHEVSVPNLINLQFTSRGMLVKYSFVIAYSKTLLLLDHGSVKSL